jgi:hypothetical protein
VQTAPQTEKKFDVLEVAAMHGPEQSPNGENIIVNLLKFHMHSTTKIKKSFKSYYF